MREIRLKNLRLESTVSRVCFEDEDKDKTEDNEEKTEKYFEGSFIFT